MTLHRRRTLVARISAYRVSWPLRSFRGTTLTVGAPLPNRRVPTRHGA